MSEGMFQGIWTLESPIRSPPAISDRADKEKAGARVRAGPIGTGSREIYSFSAQVLNEQIRVLKSKDPVLS
jgi:hypothetical protein